MLLTFWAIREQTRHVHSSSDEILEALKRFLEEESKLNGGPQPAVRHGQRMQFHWPKHSVSAQYNVKSTEFTEQIPWEHRGEIFQVVYADTSFGVFGKCEQLWAEAKGKTLDQMLVNLEREVEPLFERQLSISRTLRLNKRYEGKISDLEPEQLVRLLFCSDRDVAYTAMLEIEAHAKSGPYTPSLIYVLEDETHPNRRVAQWCALDIFEDLLNICKNEAEKSAAFAAFKKLLMNATDDYVRAVYKAGDVLGDHVANEDALEILVDVVLNGESPYGRRSAIHGFIHLCEWRPELQEQVINALKKVEDGDKEVCLREYASATIDDILRGGPHGPEPILPQEAALV